MYVIGTSFFASYPASAISYLMYFTICLASFYISKTIFQNTNIYSYLNTLKAVLFLILIAGILRFFYSSIDANIFVLVNRNATCLFLVLLAPLITFLYESKYIKYSVYLSLNILLFINILLLFGRSAIIVLLVYYLSRNLNIRKALLYSVPGLFLVLFYDIFLSDTLLSLQFLNLYDSALSLISGSYEDAPDEKRIILILSAWDIFVANPIFGVGLGLNNYLNSYDIHSTFIGQLDALRPHNFYLSLLVGSGVIGVLLHYFLFKNVFSDFLNHKILKDSIYILMFMMLFNEYILFVPAWLILGITASMPSQNQSLRC